MNDKESTALIDKVRPLVAKWKNLMRLDNHTIAIYYERGYSQEGNMDAVTHMDRWQYMEFEIKFFLPSFADYPDDELEDLVVHELTHCLLAPISRHMVPDSEDAGYQPDLMEMVTSQVASAILKVHRAEAPEETK